MGQNLPRSASGLLRLLERKDMSARDLALHFLETIDSVNGPINAVVALDAESTLAEADRADMARARHVAGALCGLPVTVKDCIDVVGYPCTGGSFARKDFRPDEDSTAVRRLRQAGAVVLGKTNCAEYLASYETHNAIHGRTNHPLDTARTPGGSSGGEGAIIAAGGSPAGLGTDGGGSIRVPAHYCGLAGLRPTIGRVPETGCWPGTRSTGLLDVHTFGPIAHSAADLFLMLSAIQGPDGADPFAAPVSLPDWTQVKVADLRVGYFVHDWLTSVTRATAATVEKAARLMSEHGCVVSEAPPPTIVSEATDLFFAAIGADGGSRMRADLQASGGRHHEHLALLLAGLSESPPAAHYFRLLDRIHAYRRELRAYFSAYDIVISPVTTGPAPRHGEPPGNLPVSDFFKFEAFNYTHLVSLAGVPSVVVPVGREGGLPLGVQVTARPFDDHVAIAAAAFLEETALRSPEPGSPPILAEGGAAAESPSSVL